VTSKQSGIWLGPFLPAIEPEYQRRVCISGSFREWLLTAVQTDHAPPASSASSRQTTCKLPFAKLEFSDLTHVPHFIALIDGLQRRGTLLFGFQIPDDWSIDCVHVAIKVAACDQIAGANRSGGRAGGQLLCAIDGGWNRALKARGVRECGQPSCTFAHQPARVKIPCLYSDEIVFSISTIVESIW
jgi:hypothetical protein